MELKMTLPEPVNGFWDGGGKQVFTWTLAGAYKDAKGWYQRVGSWDANHWFHVAKGKTDKLTLSYAKKHLRAATRRGQDAKFEYLTEANPR